MTRAVIYARLSNADEDSHSIETQVSTLDALAKKEKYTVLPCLVDDGVSGYSGKTRPAFSKLLKAINDGHVDIVMARHMDRLSRNDTDSMALRIACTKAGVKLQFADGSITDPATASGGLMATITAGMAAYESAVKTERLLAHYEAAKRNGTLKPSLVPFGWQPDKIHLDETQAAAVRRAYKVILDGGTIYSIIQQWNAPGPGHVATPGKSPGWSYAAVKAMLLRPRNAGLVKHGKSFLEGAKGEWEPIVSESDFIAASALLRDPKRRLSPGHKPRFLASGIVTCGVCGQPMRSSSAYPDAKTGERVPIYRCISKMSFSADDQRHVSAKIPVLDAMVRDAVVSAFVFGTGDLLPEETADIGPLDQKLAVVRQKKQVLVDLLRDGTLAPQEAAGQIRALRTEEEELEATRDALVAQNASAAMSSELKKKLLTDKRVSLTDVASAKVALGEKFDSLHIDQRRQLVRQLLHIRVDKGVGAGRYKITHTVVTSLNADDPSNEYHDDEEVES